MFFLNNFKIEMFKLFLSVRLRSCVWIIFKNIDGSLSKNNMIINFFEAICFISVILLYVFNNLFLFK